MAAFLQQLRPCCKADRHGHYSIIVRPGSCACASVRLANKASAFRQKPPAHESIRLLDQAGVQSSDHGRTAN
jgi:hypothetical protein